MSDPQPRKKANPATAPETDRSRKARMLVSLLGADFAKKSDHPFFRRLAETAAGETDGQGDSKGPDMSAALNGLLNALEAVGPKAAKSDPKGAAQAAPKSALTAKKPAAMPASPPPAKAQKPVTPDTQAEGDDLASQHPALIAKRLSGRGVQETSQILKTLPGPKARQVALILREIGRG